MEKDKKKIKNKKDDKATETKTTKGEYEDIQSNVIVERATSQQANLSEQGESKRHTLQGSEEEIEPEDALNLMFDYFDKHSACMQAQINNIMEPSEKL